MNTFSKLLDLATGRPLADEAHGRATRLWLVVSALLASLALAAVWGLAAGSTQAGLAFTNAYKVPGIVLLSALAALPAGLLTWKLAGGPGRATDLVTSFAGGVLAGTLVLAVSAPIVALFYGSSQVGGPLLGQGSAFLALTVGFLVFGRGVLGRAAGTRGARAVPAVVLVVAQLACIVQLISLASPILPERTGWEHGIDRLTQRAR